MHRTNPFAYPKPITLDSLDDLFSHHRTVTGGWSMTITPPEKDPPPADPPAPTPPAPPPAPDPTATFVAPTTQAEMDRIIGDRVQRERAKYADYDDVKAKAEAHDAAIEAAKSDADKAVDAARKEGESAGKKASDGRVVRAEAKSAAAVAKFRDPEVAVQLLKLDDISVGEDGEVDPAALKTKLDALALAHPYLVDDGTKPGPKPDPSQGGGGGGGDEKPGSIAEARQRAREEREKKNPKTA